MNLSSYFQFTAALIIAVILAGCGTPGVYRSESFRADTQFFHRISAGSDLVCDSAKRTLLAQGYVLEPQSEALALNGVKHFQLGESMVSLHLRVTCMKNQDGTTSVYASAQQETSELQPIKQPTGVTVGGFGFTVPSGSARIPVTVSKETVQDAEFYSRFYRQIEELTAKALRP